MPKRLFKKRYKMPVKTKLSVNVNKIATLRNARGKNIPDLIQMTKIIIEAGADGITVHPRPDERHIRYSDLILLKNLIRVYPKIEFNIEGYPSPHFLKVIKDILPDQYTLVPDPPEVLTSNAGWNLKDNKSLLKLSVQELKHLHIRSSLFIDPFLMNHTEWKSLKEISPDCIELYTAAYVSHWDTLKEKNTLLKYQTVALKAKKLGIQINAGHDLNQLNITNLLKAIPDIQEVSIGQSLIAESLKYGLENTVKTYLKKIQDTLS